MKRLVVGVLLLLCLCGCDATDKLPEQPVIDVTAEELLSFVGDWNSVTFDIRLALGTEGYSEAYAGVYQQTVDMLHMIIGEDNQAHNINSMSNELHYDRAADKLYLVVDGLPMECSASAYTAGLDRLVGIGNCVSDPIVSVVDGVYVVSGVSDVGVVSDLFGFVLESSDFSGYTVSAEFTFSDVGLSHMSWSGTSDNGWVSIDVDVFAVDETEIVAPSFVMVSAKMVQEEYSVAYIGVDDFKSAVGDSYPDNVLSVWRYFLNTYSEEDWRIMLEERVAGREEEKIAAMLVCQQRRIPYSILWESDFMSEEEFEMYSAEFLVASDV